MNRQLPESLTGRERDILQAMVEGLTNPQIAERLVLSAGTVKWYVKQLYGKLDAHTREEAIHQAIILGIVSDSRAADTTDQSTITGCRLINPLPQDVSGRYVGNTEKLARVTNLLAQQARLITIVGRAGAGKTALVCKALDDFRQFHRLSSSEVATGIVCLSATSTGITFNRLFTDLGRLLPQKDQAQLAAIVNNPELTIPQKITVALERIVGRQIILLLDNLETLQESSTGSIIEPGIQQFIETSLKQISTLTTIVTSREPLSLPGSLKTWEHLISLDEGLPIEDAVVLLRRFDPSGITGLRDAPDDDLRLVADRLGGFPRALESVAGMLLEDPLLHLADVKHDLNLLEGEISAVVVQHALSRLTYEAMQVLEALAIFGEPVSFEALSFLLAPFLSHSQLRKLLGRLIRACFVKINHTSQQFALHPIDQTYCYAQIPKGKATGSTTTVFAPAFNRTWMHLRVAEYYHGQRLPHSQWRTLSDLEPLLTEYNHLLVADDHNAAARLILDIDRDYLWEWGHKDLLRSLYSRIETPFVEARLAHHVARRRAWLKFFENAQESDQEFISLLESAQKLGFVNEEADAWDDLAQTHRRGNRNLPKAIEYHSKALKLYRQVGDRRGEADALGGLGAIYVQMDPEAAIDYLIEAAGIQRALGNYSSLAFVLTMLGTAYNSLGIREEALRTLREAVQIAEEYRSIEALIRAYGELARLYALSDDIAQSLDSIETGMALSREVSGMPMTVSLMFYVCQAAAFLALAAHVADGIDLLEKAIQAAQEFLPLAVPFGNFFMSLLFMLDGEIQNARRVFPYDPAITASRWSENNCWVVVLFIKAGEIETAMSLIKSILDLSSDDELLTPDAVTIRLRSPLVQATAYAGLALLQCDPALVERAAALASDIIRTRHYNWELYRAMINLLIQEPHGEILVPIRRALETTYDNK